MITSYASEPSKLKAAELPDIVLTYIGRIVRAFAEIEGLVNLYIGSLSKTTEADLVVLLGQSSLSKKLEIAFYLAKVAGGETLKTHTDLFDARFSNAKDTRNVVAHGILLGMTEDDRFAFMTSKTLEPNEKGTLTVVTALAEKNIKAYAQASEFLLKNIESVLQLGAWRERRLQQSLLPHRKGLTQQQRGQKPRTRPQSSGE